MSKGLDTLEEIKYKLRELEFVLRHNHQERATYISETKWNTIEKELKDFEWLKSKIDIDFIYRLPTDDRIKLIEILGVKL